MRQKTPRSPVKSRRALLLLGVLIALGVVVVLRGNSLLVGFHLGRARAALRDRQEQAALEHLQSAERLDSSRPQIQLLLARTQRRRGKLDAATHHLRRAKTLGAEAASLRAEQWLALAQAGKLADAEPHLAELASGDREDLPDVCEAFVNGYLLNYRIAEAMEMLEAWQADFPGDSQPPYCRAKVWRHLGLFSKAIPEYEKSLELAPHRLEVRLGLAEVLATQHQYDDAADHFQHCLAQQPDSAAALLGWARCLLAQGEQDQPQAILQRLLREDPDHFEALLELGRLSLSTGKAEPALPLLERAVQQQPKNPAARYELAAALQASGQTQAAREHFQYASEANQALEQARRKMQTVQEQPQEVELRYEIGQALLRYGSEKEGIAWLSSVLELAPDHPPTREALAAYYSQRQE